MTDDQFLFAYGSLIDPDSRDLPGQVGSSVPARLGGYKQGWLKPFAGTTYHGVVPNIEATTTGVLLQLSEETLNNEIDKREMNGEVYQRFQVDPTNMECLAACQPVESLWIYEVINPGHPTEGFPIWQSYLDVVLRSCLPIGEDFSRDFVQSCEDWNWPWINDRQAPRYRRVGRTTTLLEQKRIDALLSGCGVLQYRRP